jgi:hypothetical protein
MPQGRRNGASQSEKAATLREEDEARRVVRRFTREEMGSPAAILWCGDPREEVGAAAVSGDPGRREGRPNWLQNWSDIRVV